MNKKLLLLLLMIVFFDLYCCSFFIQLKPCRDIGRAFFDVESFPSPHDGQQVFPDTTYVCIFDDEHNLIAYYFYWPLHRILEKWGYFYFVKDPDEERVKYQSWFNKQLHNMLSHEQDNTLENSTGRNLKGQPTF